MESLEVYPYHEPLIDTHAHYDDAKFDEVRDELLTALPRFGVKAIVNNAVDCYDSAKAVLALCERYDFLYGAIGVHPENAETNGPLDLGLLERLLRGPKIVALGEIGLDYYYCEDNKEKQKKYFEDQLGLAHDMGLPVVVHDREAHGDTMELLRKYRPKGTVHCFSGSAESALETVKLGMMIGIGGVLTFKNARKTVEVVEAIPLDRILLETDAPYLSPEPWRGKLNHSARIVKVAEKIAEIKGESVETVLRITRENAEALYGI